MAGFPGIMDYTEEVKPEPVLGWFGEHKKLEKDTHQLRADADAGDEGPNGPGGVEAPEVLAARKRRERLAAALSKPSTDQLRRSFEEFDLNSDGKLDISEVKVLLKAGKPSMKDREIEAIFKKVDKNCDRCISFNELVSWVFSSEDSSEIAKVFHKKPR
mmetsp:Transcript_20210/g.33705  ORF Transcript_20210/g.33705 Transcript_20210/m.33705 type:complete len:159 (+) Transcript_20210:46-522(+)